MSKQLPINTGKRPIDKRAVTGNPLSRGKPPVRGAKKPSLDTYDRTAR